MTVQLTGGRLVTRCLVKEGVQHIFCVPGESYLEVLDGLYDEPSVGLISTRHEGGAAFMAEAYAKASGRVGVCMATRAVGLSNLSIGLHTAKQDSTPVVALVGQVPQDHLDKEAFQEVPLAAWFQSVCKWTVEIRQAERIPELLHRAFAVARSDRPGPVLVALPQDVLETVVSHVQDIIPYQTTLPQAESSSLREVHHYLCEAKRPMMIVGGGVLASGASELVVEVARRYALPVAAAFRRFDAISNLDPCYAGWLGFGPHSALVEAFQEADLVLAIGTRLSQVTTQDYTLFGPSARVIFVDVNPLSGAASYSPSQLIVADASAFCQALLQLEPAEGTPMPGAVRDFRLNRMAQLHQAYLGFSRPRSLPPASQSESSDSGEKEGVTSNLEASYVDLETAVVALSDTVPKDTIVTSDAGNFFGWLARYYRFEQPRTYIGPTSGAMGYGLPAALAAKLAHPDKTVIAVAGDGGFMMTMAEMATAMLYNIQVVAIVVNNNLYGTIRAHQQRLHRGRPLGTGLYNPSIAQLARTFGGYGETVSSTKEFLPALKRALQEERFAVIEVLSNPEILSVSMPNHDGKGV